VKRLLQSALLAVILSGVAFAQGYNNSSGYLGSNAWNGGGYSGSSGGGGGGGGGPIVYVSGSVASTLGNPTLAVPYPATRAAGQMAYAFIFIFGGTDPYTVSAPGWTFVNKGPQPMSSWAVLVLRRLLDGTESGSVTFTVSANNFYEANIRIYSGVNPTTPEDPAVGNPVFAKNVSGPPSTTTFTTTKDGDMVIAYVADWNSAVVLTTPAGFGNGIIDSANGTGKSQASWDMLQAVKGPLGTITSGTPSGNDAWAMSVLALQH
jgi:hypothetical protein